MRRAESRGNDVHSLDADGSRQSKKNTRANSGSDEKIPWPVSDTTTRYRHWRLGNAKPKKHPNQMPDEEAQSPTIWTIQRPREPRKQSFQT